MDEALSERYAPLLDIGTRLFVLDGPVLGSGYDWFQVIVPTVTRSDGQPMVGWVAVAGKNGEVWAKNVDLGCPPANAQVALADLARLGSGATPDGGLACFGDGPIATTASLAIVCNGPDATATGNDELARGAGPDDGPPGRRLDRLRGPRPPRSRGPHGVRPADGGDVGVDGHFSDSEAQACGGGASSDAAAALAIYRCRTTFVITGLTASSP